LCYYAYKITNNQESSKDIVQDVFLKYHSKPAEFSSELAIKNFLYLAVKNACLNFIRHDLVEKKFAENQVETALDQDQGLSHIIKAEALIAIKKAIEALPEGCRTVLKLAFFEGFKNEQIALELGISINTVKTQKQRALQLLRLKFINKA
jgi:RNA polymerase sigma-70 factor (family 1)